MTFVNSAFFERLQREDVGNLVEIIQLQGKGFDELYTTCNQEVFATLSGTLRMYRPFPGNVAGKIQSTTDLTVATLEFFAASSAAANLLGLLHANQLDDADLIVERVFTDTPDLDRMPVYRGKVGNITFNRNGMKGQGRNIWDSYRTVWPYYTYGDGCAWRFGGAGCGFNTTSVTQVVSPAGWNPTSSSVIGLYCNSIGDKIDGYFDFGRITFLNGANSGQVRTIRDHAGPALRLSHRLQFAPESGTLFSIYPGCRKRRVDDCTSKYNNARNFNGYWTTPIPEQFITPQ